MITHRLIDSSSHLLIFSSSNLLIFSSSFFSHRLFTDLASDDVPFSGQNNLLNCWMNWAHRPYTDDHQRYHQLMLTHSTHVQLIYYISSLIADLFSSCRRSDLLESRILSTFCRLFRSSDPHVAHPCCRPFSSQRGMVQLAHQLIWSHAGDGRRYSVDGLETIRYPGEVRFSSCSSSHLIVSSGVVWQLDHCCWCTNLNSLKLTLMTLMLSTHCYLMMILFQQDQDW